MSRDHALLALASSAADRRVLEELLADWRFEHVRSRGAAAAAVVSVRWSIAIAGAVTRMAAREVLLSSPWQTIAVAFLLSCGLTLVSFSWAPPRSIRTSGWHDPAVLWLLPQGAAVWLAPIVALVIGASRRVPLLATCAIGFVAMLALVGWVIPESNQQYRQTTYSRVGQESPLRSLPRGLSELTLPHLFGWRQQSVPAAAVREQLAGRAGMVAWSCAGVGLGIVIQRRRRVWQSRWKSGAVAVLTVGTALAGAALTGVLLDRTLDLSPRYHLQVWIIVGWFAVVARLLTRSPLSSEGRE